MPRRRRLAKLKFCAAIGERYAVVEALPSALRLTELCAQLRRQERLQLLPPELIERLSQRGIGDVDQPEIRVSHVDDQEHGAGHR
jgi:hypothetical protein